MSRVHVPALELPDGFDASTPWERTDEEETSVDRLNRAEWSVRVGDGDRHRLVCATRSGDVVAECDCDGWAYHDWCAHVCAVFRAYINGDVVLADLDDNPAEEVDALWRAQGQQGGQL